ncbi:uncharacterized protein F5Z01DRAFT_691084 [Emericellopsis atlantica]|uniref:Uncharacterized protein n=1 Tax=Emericellopsis atlantica TaxID=2614577 RepID=A0A9P7ZIE0_9HYPO|nr:uncharacterized protein F5Z01DRAFT_691084 [Emericellopsis atlantica]KAG9252352.1 hypothetical protein F5Z01DRAFT_691084 [Emericellopsis atlantica]
MRLTPQSVAILSAALSVVDAALQEANEPLIDESFDPFTDGTWGTKNIDGVEWKYLEVPGGDYVPWVSGETIQPDPGFENEYYKEEDSDADSTGQLTKFDLESAGEPNDVYYTLCEEAINCEVRVDEDGNKVIHFMQDMEIDSEWWNSTFAPTLSEDLDLDDDNIVAGDSLESRAHHCHGHKICTEISMRHARTNYGSRPPKDLIPALKNHCINTGCNASPFKLNTQVWRTVSTPAKLLVTPSGIYSIGQKPKLIDLIGKAIRSKTKIKNHYLCIANPVTGTCDPYSLKTLEASKYFQVARFVRNGAGQLALHGSLGVAVKLTDVAGISCADVVSALTSAVSGVPGGGYFGFLSLICS